MTQTTQRKSIGLFGGTFDPIHFGHLRMALELKQSLGLQEMRMLPSGLPPHRQRPAANATERGAMLRLALAGCSALSIDERELHSASTGKPAYSIDTLESFRREFGEDVSLCLAIGMDSLVSLSSWHRWRELLTLAHIVVAARPGWHLPDSGEVAELVAKHRAGREAIAAKPGGAIVIQSLSLLPISSTGIRGQITAGLSPQFLLPDPVWAYIRERGLYGAS